LFSSSRFSAPLAIRCPFVVVCDFLFLQIGILFVAVPVEVAVFAFAAIRAEAVHESSAYPLAAFAVFFSVWTLQVLRLDYVSVLDCVFAFMIVCAWIVLACLIGRVLL
jgi:hypothetical protein